MSKKEKWKRNRHHLDWWKAIGIDIQCAAISLYRPQLRVESAQESLAHPALQIDLRRYIPPNVPWIALH